MLSAKAFVYLVPVPRWRALRDMYSCRRHSSAGSHILPVLQCLQTVHKFACRSALQSGLCRWARLGRAGGSIVSSESLKHSSPGGTLPSTACEAEGCIICCRHCLSRRSSAPLLPLMLWRTVWWQRGRGQVRSRRLPVIRPCCCSDPGWSLRRGLPAVGRVWAQPAAQVKYR